MHLCRPPDTRLRLDHWSLIVCSAIVMFPPESCAVRWHLLVLADQLLGDTFWGLTNMTSADGEVNLISNIEWNIAVSFTQPVSKKYIC